MDKWKLLRSALQGKRESDSTASIHRNDGIFSVIEKQFTAWAWTMEFTVDADSTLEMLKQACHAYMIVRDIVEVSLLLSASSSGSGHLQGLVESAVLAGYCRLKHEGHSETAAPTTVEVYWQDVSITPFMPNCKFYKWTLSSGDVLFARKVITTRYVLSTANTTVSAATTATTATTTATTSTTTAAAAATCITLLLSSFLTSWCYTGRRPRMRA
jgi:hypothetical protein